jgi:hypothetical protein
LFRDKPSRSIKYKANKIDNLQTFARRQLAAARNFVGSPPPLQIRLDDEVNAIRRVDA